MAETTRGFETDGAELVVFSVFHAPTGGVTVAGGATGGATAGIGGTGAGALGTGMGAGAGAMGGGAGATGCACGAKHAGCWTHWTSSKLGTWVEFCPVDGSVAPVSLISGYRPGFCGACCAMTAAIWQKPFHAPTAAWSQHAALSLSSAMGMRTDSRKPAPGKGKG